jgi:hypothetical protein
LAKILIFLATLLPLSLFAISADEEALILNQELEFLESAAKNLEVNTQTAVSAPIESRNSGSDKSLEDTYFGDTERDEVNIRRAAPKRRSF